MYVCTFYIFYIFNFKYQLSYVYSVYSIHTEVNILIQLGVMPVQEPRLVQFLVAGPNKIYPSLQVKLTVLPTVLSNSTTVPLLKLLILGHCISIRKHQCIQ